MKKTMTDTDYLDMNRQGWDERARAHFTSKFYDVAGFLKGGTSLREIELAELTEVAGKSLLHLQCHFGMDTLSWVRKGARCTGVDLSSVAIAQAHELSEKAGVEAQFVCSDVYSFANEETAPFDIVYTSYGALCWLPDLDRWAQLVADKLVAGGVFYMVEFHPLYDLLEGYSYFTLKEPDIEESSGYTENSAHLNNQFAVWSHPLSSVVNALIKAGIQIDRLNEFPFSPYNCFPGMQERESGRFYLQHREQDIPIVYSITGHKKT